MSKTISRTTSIYLDLMRAASAVLVFSIHIRNFLLPELRYAMYGSEAVAVFFVLSGYVIGFTIENKHTDLRSFLAARISRIYPVAILAILVTWIVDTIGWSADPQYYLGLATHFFARSTHGFGALAFLQSFTFTNQIWFSHAVWGSGEPYWALGFEVPYYFAAALLVHLKGGARWFWIAVWCLICGPVLAMFLPLWLFGAVCQRLVSRDIVRSGWIALATFVAACWGLVRLVKSGAINPVSAIYLNPTPLLAWHNFLYFSMIGVCAGLSVVAVDRVCGTRNLCPVWVEKAIRWVAGGSFTLYLVHQPLAMLASVFVRVGRDGLAARALGAAAVFVVAMALAEVAERRRNLYAPVIERWMRKS